MTFGYKQIYVSHLFGYTLYGALRLRLASPRQTHTIVCIWTADGRIQRVTPLELKSAAF